MLEKGMEKPVLYHVYDPMCSWCWGYRKTWLRLSEALEKQLTIHTQLGGLAPDSDAVMPIALQETLQGIWQTIHTQLGATFNFDFWTECQPQRSTYPACRACLVAREHNKEHEMLYAIQQAYYLKAKNPSLVSTLGELAAEIGLDRENFEQRLQSIDIDEQLMREIQVSRQLPIQGFPSLVLSVKGQLIPIKVDYLDWQKTYSEIIGYLG